MPNFIRKAKKRKLNERQQIQDESSNGWSAYIHEKFVCQNLNDNGKYETHYYNQKHKLDDAIQVAKRQCKESINDKLAGFILKDIIQDFILDNETKNYLVNSPTYVKPTKGNSNNKK